MGYKAYLVKEIIIYITVLIAAMSILYLFTYPIIQKSLLATVNTDVAAFRSSFLKKSAGHAVNITQVNLLADKYKQSLLSAYGLNQPIFIKYAIQMKNLLLFRFGNAYFLSAPSGSIKVADIIAAYLPYTILLFTTGTIIVIVIGTILGLLSARYAGTAWDKIIPTIAIIHSSLPTWWLGFLLIAALAYGIKIFPPGGIVSVPPPKEPFMYAINLLYHMALPLLAFFIVNVGGFAYVVRSLVISVTKEDFVTTAKARGLPDSRILYRHILRTASPSISTQVALAIAGSFAGGLTTEIVFNWHGVGWLTYVAILLEDVPVILGITFVLTVILLIALFIDELVKGILDPRIKAGE
ncbi:ABC-type dipeptide/oligopeptide/nickel transport system, permease component [Caldisphaera lagunensis DSM 15908]|uniref:ABC-type dipeptide/oligopeptide/nickel transport system, permease component n=1 Tax=Caldisphaera lagunensis (strain DSM 15908 / JCM 11604 / ANMR 0165 / IC-154) TaxID=1056495 RepID=L0ACD1_CALLD|nr:ABC transporter permease subunit [Caldisphaera lagunensis]AFZ70792.1 ABC-type dipeptide/oligopeptide/nickel transport system, permease component [Caldisphaera lagunensis DSM 15908]